MYDTEIIKIQYGIVETPMPHAIIIPYAQQILYIMINITNKFVTVGAVYKLCDNRGIIMGFIKFHGILIIIHSCDAYNTMAHMRHGKHSNSRNQVSLYVYSHKLQIGIQKTHLQLIYLRHNQSMPPLSPPTTTMSS